MVGIIVALAGLGPERVEAGLLAAMAAVLCGALLDERIESKVKPSGRGVPEEGTTIVPPPEQAQWVDARRPLLDEPSTRWTAVSRRDCAATYLSSPAAPDALCTRCGRTVLRPAGDRPADCPDGDGPVFCVLKDRHDFLVTEFKRLRNVSSEGPA